MACRPVDGSRVKLLIRFQTVFVAEDVPVLGGEPSLKVELPPLVPAFDVPPTRTRTICVVALVAPVMLNCHTGLEPLAPTPVWFGLLSDIVAALLTTRLVHAAAATGPVIVHVEVGVTLVAAVQE